MTSSTDLAAFLCSRLCHDLLNPVGAITSGLELLEDETDPEMRRSSFELLEKSARTSSVKLQFFRFAYGSPGGVGDAVPCAEARRLLEALLEDHGRIELQWAVEADELSVPAIKILLNFAAIGTKALVRGGLLAVGAETRDGATEIVMRAAGERIAFDPAVGQALDGALEETELSAHNAHAFLIRNLADELGGNLQHAVSPDTLLLGALLPARRTNG